jgi:hypothetical protein
VKTALGTEHRVTRVVADPRLSPDRQLERRGRKAVHLAERLALQFRAPAHEADWYCRMTLLQEHPAWSAWNRIRRR